MKAQSLFLLLLLAVPAYPNEKHLTKEEIELKRLEQKEAYETRKELIKAAIAITALVVTGVVKVYLLRNK